MNPIKIKISNNLTDGHGAQNVQENEGTFSVVIATQSAMRKILYQRDGGEGQTSDHETVKPVCKISIKVSKRYCYKLW